MERATEKPFRSIIDSFHFQDWQHCVSNLFSELDRIPGKYILTSNMRQSMLHANEEHFALFKYQLLIMHFRLKIIDCYISRNDIDNILPIVSSEWVIKSKVSIFKG